jgi:hypothetical protein
MIFMVSSRDRNCQRIEMTREVIARAPPPAFLFPNQQCQRPRAEAPRTASQQHHRLAPGVGGGGYLSNLETPVKSFFAKRFEPKWPTREIPDPPEWAASREADLVSQPIILKKLQNNWLIDLTPRR